MFALPVILIFTILLITIQIPIICTLYYSQNYMLKMLSIKLSINMESHPLRVRGLKLYRFSFSLFDYSGRHPLRMRHVPFSERSNHHRFNLLSEFVSLLRITILSIIINKIQTTTKRKCHYSSIDCSYVIYLY